MHVSFILQLRQIADQIPPRRLCDLFFFFPQALCRTIFFIMCLFCCFSEMIHRTDDINRNMMLLLLEIFFFFWKKKFLYLLTDI